MATPQQLIDALEAELFVGSASGYQPADHAYDVYEGYVLGLMLRAVKRLGLRHRYLNRDGHPVHDLRLRKGPGQIYGASHFTHVEIDAPAGRLEAHVGIAVKGASGVEHEFDLVVLPKAAGDAARRNGVAPAFHEVLIQAECKFLTTTDTPLGYGRGFVGLSTDCLLYGCGALVSNRPSDSVYRLLRAHGLIFRYNVRPGDTRAERYLVDRFVRILRP